MTKIYNLLITVALSISVTSIKAEQAQNVNQETEQPAQLVSKQELFERAIKHLQDEIQKLNKQIEEIKSQVLVETGMLIDLLMANVTEEDERFIAQKASFDALVAQQKQLETDKQQKIEKLTQFMVALKHINKS